MKLFDNFAEKLAYAVGYVLLFPLFVFWNPRKSEDN